MSAWDSGNRIEFTLLASFLGLIVNILVCACIALIVHLITREEGNEVFEPLLYVPKQSKYDILSRTSNRTQFYVSAWSHKSALLA